MIIATNNYKKTPTGIYYIDSYFPYRTPDGARNPLFNAYSGMILDLKEGKLRGFEYFQGLIIDRKLYDGDYSIISIPGSDPAKESNHGTRLFVEHLLGNTNLKKAINGCEALVRKFKVEKSVGGDRSVKKHLDSIEIDRCDLVSGRNVLLIDDVTTTGNSFEACKKILKDGGAKEIISIAMGH